MGDGEKARSEGVGAGACPTALIPAAVPTLIIKGHGHIHLTGVRQWGPLGAPSPYGLGDLPGSIATVKEPGVHIYRGRNRDSTPLITVGG